MSEDTPDGVTQATITHFENYTLPRLLQLQQKVSQGSRLDERDADFLQKLLQRLTADKAKVDLREDWQLFYQRLISLCHDITEKGLKNASNASSRLQS
jgi:hypothetical protein